MGPGHYWWNDMWWGGGMWLYPLILLTIYWLGSTSFLADQAGDHPG